MWLFDLGFCSGLRVVGFGGFVTWRLFGGLGLGSRSRGLGPQVGHRAECLGFYVQLEISATALRCRPACSENFQHPSKLSNIDQRDTGVSGYYLKFHW